MHAQNAAIFSPKSGGGGGGKNHIGSTFQIRLVALHFLHKNMSINPKSVEFHQCHAKRHSICFFFFTNIKDNDRNRCQDLLTIRTRKCTRCIMQMIYLYASDFPFKIFRKIAAQHAETIQKMFEKRVMTRILVDKSTDHDKPHFHLFSARVFQLVFC